MISDQAVEAAKKVAFERYGSKPDAAYLRTILEAAAPHIIAAALREAADALGDAASWSDSTPSTAHIQRWLESRANVYRSQP